MSLLATIRKTVRYLTLSLAVAVVLLPFGTWASSPAGGTAAVAMPDHFAAQATRQVLRNGGNAIDAAVTATFILAVTLPEAGNIGGGGFMISHMNGENTFLDFRERAPAKAHRDMFLDEGGNFVQKDALLGGRASGVPGTVRGMHEAHKRYGSKPWASLIRPAIILARDGFRVQPQLAQFVSEAIAEWGGETNFAEFFSSAGEGKIFKQPALAATLQRIANNPDEFYTGLTARQITAQMIRSGGLITMEDLANYNAVWRTPLIETWRDYTVVTTPPPSSGGIALVQMLKMRDFADQHFRGVWHNSPQYIHLLAEIEKRVFADRAEYLGDPDFVTVPMAALLKDDYIQARAREINPAKISTPRSVVPGLEPTHTTHFSILDKDGNAVAVTSTLNWDFGSGVVVEGAGFLMNNEMDDFSAKAGVKNEWGVVGGLRNAIAPGKRMLSSMTPTILLKDEQAALILGTMGGSTIFTSVFQVILNVYDYNMPLQDAVNSNRYHHQLPDAFLIRHDPREIPQQTSDALTKMGYSVQANSWGVLGDVQAIKIEGGVVEAASDNRGRGASLLID